MIDPSGRGMRYESVLSAVRFMYESFSKGAVVPAGTVMRQQMPLQGIMEGAYSGRRAET